MSITLDQSHLGRNEQVKITSCFPLFILSRWGRVIIDVVHKTRFDFYLCLVDDDGVFVGFLMIRLIDNFANALDHCGRYSRLKRVDKWLDGRKTAFINLRSVTSPPLTSRDLRCHFETCRKLCYKKNTWRVMHVMDNGKSDWQMGKVQVGIGSPFY